MDPKDFLILFTKSDNTWVGVRKRTNGTPHYPRWESHIPMTGDEILFFIQSWSVEISKQPLQQHIVPLFAPGNETPQ